MGIRQRGIAQSMFQYGDVRCETAAAGRTFVFRGVADPQAVLHEIETYNQLVPADGELSATVMIEIDDRDTRDAWNTMLSQFTKVMAG